MRTKKTLILASLMLVAVFVLSGCTQEKTTKFSKPNIKDDFCGVVMNFQYCKCAFHDEYCDSIGLSSSAANTYVQDEYNKWLDQRKKNFGSECEQNGGIYNGNDKCTYCQDPYYKKDNKCVKADEEADQEEGDDDQTGFVPDGPFNADCSINEDLFNNDWEKYSDFDANIEFNSRSWEVQQSLGVYEKIMALKVRNFELERDMEIDRQSRLVLRDYKQALVQNIRTNLLKSFWRLSYVTYSTIKSGKGVGESYSKVLTSGQTLERISQGLKVVQAVIPGDSSLAIDTNSVSGKVKSIGLNAALEAFDSMGDPVKIATQVFNDAGNAVLPSADISPEEIEILRTQHLKNGEIDKALAESYRKNAIRRMELLDNRKWIEILEAEVASWGDKEKARVQGMLEADCNKQKAQWEEDNKTSFNFINKASAQEIEEQTYELGDYRILYNQETTAEDNSKDYYQGENLVLSVYDTNGNGQDDLWLNFDEEFYLILEAYDTTGDGQPDTFVELDNNEAITKLVQPEVNEVEIIAEDSDGPISKAEVDNDNDDKSNNTWIPIFIVILVLGVVAIKKYKK